MRGDGLLFGRDFCSQTACQTSQLEFSRKTHAVRCHSDKQSLRNMVIHVIGEDDHVGKAIGFVFITMVVFSSANVGAWWFVIRWWRCKWNEKSSSPWAARWVSVNPLQGQTAIRATRKGFNEVTWKVRVVILYDRMTECLCFYWEVSWSCG